MRSANYRVIEREGDGSSTICSRPFRTSRYGTYGPTILFSVSYVARYVDLHKYYDVATATCDKTTIPYSKLAFHIFHLQDSC